MGDEKDGIPPILGVAILLHEPHAHVIFLRARQLHLGPDGSSVVEPDVDDNGGNGGEGKPVGQSELGREDTAGNTFVVLRLVEDTGGQDASHIVPVLPVLS